MKTMRTKRVLVKLRRLFRKSSAKSDLSPLCYSSFGAFSAHFLIHQDAKFDPWLEYALKDYRMQYLLLGCRLTTEYTTNKMPDGYIAIVTYRHGMKLQSQIGLRKRVKYVPKTSVDSEMIFESTCSAPRILIDNRSRVRYICSP